MIDLNDFHFQSPVKKELGISGQNIFNEPRNLGSDLDTIDLETNQWVSAQTHAIAIRESMGFQWALSDATLCDVYES